jgi:putative CocE/NonD family hydrolase
MTTRVLSKARVSICSAVCALTVWACDPDLPEFVSYLETDFEPRYERSTTDAMYLTMRDGVRIAVDVTLPFPVPATTRIPTIVAMTRYWRAEQGEEPDWRIGAAVNRGYAFVYMDERGTGASFGTWPYPWSETSLADFHEVVDWVVDQYWSNGRVGAWGISYLGMSAQFLPTTGHPAVRAVIPAFTQYDVYTDIAFPGGLFSEWFVGNWSAATALLDANEWPGDPDRGVKRVDADHDGSLLEQAVSEHAQNGSVYEGFRDVTYRDQVSPLSVTMDDISAHNYRSELEASDVAIYGWGSWMDHGSAHATITRFATLSNPQQAVIGAWTHGGWGHASPFQELWTEPDPSEGQQWDETLHFFDQYLKESGPGSTERMLYYYTMGAEEWRSTSVWPVEGTTLETWHFAAGNTLASAAPSDAVGRDTYAVDFAATSGEHTRWHTPLDGPVQYPDRHNEDYRLLTYTSEPLPEELEVTGYPVVTLYVTSTHTDGAFFAYLEDVDPNGRVTYVTEGQLRALHRKVSTQVAPYELSIPYHSFQEADGEPLVPGQITEISFGLLPTSVVFQAGHSIRVAIAGHDNGIFARVPQSGDPVVTVERNATHPSRISLPVVRFP